MCIKISTYACEYHATYHILHGCVLRNIAIT